MSVKDNIKEEAINTTDAIFESVKARLMAEFSDIQDDYEITLENVVAFGEKIHTETRRETWAVAIKQASNIELIAETCKSCFCNAVNIAKAIKALALPEDTEGL